MNSRYSPGSNVQDAPSDHFCAFILVILKAKQVRIFIELPLVNCFFLHYLQLLFPHSRSGRWSCFGKVLGLCNSASKGCSKLHEDRALDIIWTLTSIHMNLKNSPSQSSYFCLDPTFKFICRFPNVNINTSNLIQLQTTYKFGVNNKSSEYSLIFRSLLPLNFATPLISPKMADEGTSRASASSFSTKLRTATAKLMATSGTVSVPKKRKKAATTFPLDKLPFELRNMVWGYVSQQSRVVIVRNSNLYYTSTTPAPAMLHTCHEAREVGLRSEWIEFSIYTSFNVRELQSSTEFLTHAELTPKIYSLQGTGDRGP